MREVDSRRNHREKTADPMIDLAARSDILESLENASPRKKRLNWDFRCPRLFRSIVSNTKRTSPIRWTIFAAWRLRRAVSNSTAPEATTKSRATTRLDALWLETAIS